MTASKSFRPSESLTAEVVVIFGISRLAEIISDNSAVFHYEPDPFDFRDVGNWIAGHSDHIGKFSRLDRTDAVLPTQHFGRIGGDGANDVERRHAGIAQMRKDLGARLPARFSRGKPAHVRASCEFYAGFQNSPNQFVVLLFVLGSGTVVIGTRRRRSEDRLITAL